MRYLLDTGILLRLVERASPLHSATRQAVLRLKRDGHGTVTAVQNMTEFWNVCTRPVAARGGFGLTDEQARRRLRTIERIAVVLPYPANLYEHWKQLVVQHRIRGVQVHDAKIAALMNVYQVTHLLTLNPDDFRRFDSIAAVTPDQVIAG